MDNYRAHTHAPVIRFSDLKLPNSDPQVLPCFQTLTTQDAPLLVGIKHQADPSLTIDWQPAPQVTLDIWQGPTATPWGWPVLMDELVSFTDSGRDKGALGKSWWDVHLAFVARWAMAERGREFIRSVEVPKNQLVCWSDVSA